MQAGKMENEQADVASLLEVNNLDYRLPPSLSIASSRSMRSYPAIVPTVQMGQTITFVISTGATYVDLQNSFLSFNVKFSGPNMTGLRMPAHTGWANAFAKYTIIHSSGVELDRQNESVGEWIQIQQYYNTSRDKRRIQGSLYKHNDTSHPASLIQDTAQGLDDLKEGTWYNEWADSAPAAGSEIWKYPDGRTDSQLTGSFYGGWQKKFSVLGAAGNFAAPVDKDLLIAPWPVASLDRHKDNTGAFVEDLALGGVGTDSKPVHIVIPLSTICPIFANTLLAPSYLMAGLRVELTLQQPELFFQSIIHNPGGAALSHRPWDSATMVCTLDKCTINMETFTLSDAITRKLAQVSADTGLEWSWDAVHQTGLTSPNQNVSVQVNRALSRANAVVVKARRLAAIQSTAFSQLFSTYASEPWLNPALTTVNTLNNGIDGSMTGFQVQLGAQYIPASKIAYPEEFLHSALKTFAQFRRNDEVGGIPMSLFTGLALSRTIVTSDVAGEARQDRVVPGLAIAAVPLESSSTLQQSGAAISAQRTAVVNIDFHTARADGAGADSSTRRIDLFIPYTKLATLFLDSVVVRS